MKKYLEIFVGSRGYLESVCEREFESIEGYLEGEYLKSKKLLEEGFEEGDSEEYKEEVLESFNWGRVGSGEVYYLSIGDEEVKYYIGIGEEVYINWRKDIGEVKDWEDVDDNKIFDLVYRVGM